MRYLIIYRENIFASCQTFYLGLTGIATEMDLSSGLEALHKFVNWGQFKTVSYNCKEVQPKVNQMKVKSKRIHLKVVMNAIVDNFIKALLITMLVV